MEESNKELSVGAVNSEPCPSGVSADWLNLPEDGDAAEQLAVGIADPETDGGETYEEGDENKADTDGAGWPEDPSQLTEDDDDFDLEDRREAEQSFTLKHLGEIRTVGRDEVIALAQKGLDYDRQRQKNEELAARNNALLSETSRLGRTPESTAAEKRDTDIREFLDEYRTIDPKEIPDEVWQAVKTGKSLLASYQSWELKKLREDSRATAKNAENKERSAGSRQSAGNQRQRDPITADWYS